MGSTPVSPLLAGLVAVLAAGCRIVAPAPEASAAPGDEGLPTVEDFTRGMESLDGFVPLHWDEAKGRLYLETPPVGEELLYLVGLTAGLGSNQVGLDRGQLGDRKLVLFRPVGPRVQLVEPNLKWRTSRGSGAVRRGVRDSFAESVLWGFDIVARSGDRRLVDATDFFLRDAHRVGPKLARAAQGSFTLDESRSSLWLEGTRGFPRNTEVEALLTFRSDEPGSEVRATASDPHSVSVRVRHSFVRLPELDGSFRPRVHDPRCGLFTASWHDVGVAVDEPMIQNVIARHRLTAESPIVYYVDRAAPEPVRTALLEGARYWTPVFAAAGFPRGFRAELLPEDADPLDVRYDVIQWVSRSTRGWSYGDAVTDPRTGEILKGHVSLGALRVRQDVLLAEGLLSPYVDGEESDPRVLAMALARIRQLAAHEVGHTLGLRHNFAASASGRASVMDYPAPLVGIEDGLLDLSNAYRDGCGEWDELAIRYGYAPFEPREEAAGLAAVLRDMDESGIAFLTDSDARGPDRAHPLANLWDNGSDPVAQLRHEIEVRRIALEGFSAAALRPGEPMSALEDVLVPLYFHHRYQLEAAVRRIGGVWYEHGVRGGGDPQPMRPVDGAEQEAALGAAIATLSPSFLALPEGALALIPARAPGSDPFAERFEPDSLFADAGAAEAACIQMTLDLLLDPVRAARLVDQGRRDPALLGFDDLLDRLVQEAFSDPEHVRGELRAQILERMIALTSDDGVPLGVQRAALDGVERLSALHVAGAVALGTEEHRRQASWERNLIRHFLDDPLTHRPAPRRRRVPPGSPIGCGFQPAR